MALEAVSGNHSTTLSRKSQKCNSQRISEQISVTTTRMQAGHSSLRARVDNLIIPTISLFPAMAGPCRGHQAGLVYKDSKLANQIARTY